MKSQAYLIPINCIYALVKQVKQVNVQTIVILNKTSLWNKAIDQNMLKASYHLKHGEIKYILYFTYQTPHHLCFNIITCVFAFSDINLIRSITGTSSKALILILTSLWITQYQIKLVNTKRTFNREITTKDCMEAAMFVTRHLSLPHDTSHHLRGVTSFRPFN